MADRETRSDRYDEARKLGSEDPEVRSRSRGEDESVLTLVCLRCGTEYYFDEGGPPDSLECEKCRNRVFRAFDSLEADDDAALDFSDSTERDLRPDDPEGDVLPGDVLDLNRD